MKKKTRGLRSKVKRIEKWKAENIELDVDAKNSNILVYMKGKLYRNKVIKEIWKSRRASDLVQQADSSTLCIPSRIWRESGITDNI